MKYEIIPAADAPRPVKAKPNPPEAPVENLNPTQEDVDRAWSALSLARLGKKKSRIVKAQEEYFRIREFYRRSQREMA